jgi:lipoprotein-releasing system ATP-binding protein
LSLQIARGEFVVLMGRDWPFGRCRLSGGTQQRVAIARALVLEPPLVLADEPTGNLDTQSANEVFDVMRRMHAALKVSFLLVTHDPRLAARCDRVIELIDGRIERDEAVAVATQPEPADANPH